MSKDLRVANDNFPNSFFSQIIKVPSNQSTVVRDIFYDTFIPKDEINKEKGITWDMC